jgi:predicted acyl esterase
MCLPPDPALVGDSWRAMWLERLQNIPLFQENWLRHQRRDAYWKHGSVCEDYAAIQCPVDKKSERGQRHDERHQR